MSRRPVGIVGGGIIGLAIGRELMRRFPGLEVVVFEKETRVGTHQTGHNSGVVHAGIYYRPGSLKARLCTRGRSMLREFCRDRSIPYEECGKLVIAVDDSEIGRLDALERTAGENRVPGLRRVGRGEIKEIEPYAAGLAGLHSPATAITDFALVAQELANEMDQEGGRVLLSSPVESVRRSSGAIEVVTPSQSHFVDKLIVCAGLDSDRVSEPLDGRSEPRIVPFRGEYMLVSQEKKDLVRGLIYPVPDPRYPFLGVHFTRTVAGELEVGPNAVLALKREDYRGTGFDVRDVLETLTWPGFWRLAAANWRIGLEELWGSMSVKAYMKKANRYVPSIGAEDVERGRVGVRAQALDRDGSLVDDFRIYETDGVVTVRNAPSPGATSSLAIAEHVIDRIGFPGSS